MPFPPVGSGHWNKQYSDRQLGFVLESTKLFTAERKRKNKSIFSEENELLGNVGSWGIGLWDQMEELSYKTQIYSQHFPCPEQPTTR